MTLRPVVRLKRFPLATVTLYVTELEVPSVREPVCAPTVTFSTRGRADAGGTNPASTTEHTDARITNRVPVLARLEVRSLVNIVISC